MAGTTAKFHSQNKNSSRNRKDDGFSGEQGNLEEMIFGFTEEFVEEGSCESSCSSSAADVDFDDEAIIDEDDENSFAIEKEANNKAFWESQEDLLMTTLFRTTSTESKIRQAIKEAMKEMNSGGFDCVCEKMIGSNSCKNCMQKEVSNRLKMAGFNCLICKSKWRKSSGIPSGEHTYMEVVQNPSSSSAKSEMKIIIELNFRAQFEMARGSEEYNRLINNLPEVFVGKFARLENLVKILCASLKKSMEERKMHLAPWRKHKYMLAKWQGSPDHNGVKPGSYLWPNGQLGRSTRPRASMLTYDLLDGLQVIPCSAMIRVVM